jgi:hypothetical protein
MTDFPLIFENIRLWSSFGPESELMKQERRGVEGVYIPSPRFVFCVAVCGAE